MNHPLELTVMMYHYIRDPNDAAAADSGIPGLSVSAFEAQLEDLARQHTLVTWTDVRMAIEGNHTLPGSACLLTFDDGVCDHYLNAFRVLQRRKLSGLFFILDRSNEEALVLGHKIHFLLAKLGADRLRDVIWEKLNPVQKESFVRAERRYQLDHRPVSADGKINLLKAVLQRDLSDEVDALLSELVERHIGPEKDIARSYYLNADQIREMSAAGMHFGGHSRRHPWFDWITETERRSEIKASADWIRQFEPGPWAFAYPYGGISNDAPALLEEYGFVAAFTTQTQARHTDPYFIGRMDGEELASKSGFYA